MCGQLGFSGTQSFDVQKIKTLILWNSLERGEDATGMYSPKNGLKKCLLKGSDFIINKNYEIEPDTMFMAHCRAKTVGSNTVNNAHPFHRDNIILQHNGTIKNHYSLLNKYDLKYADYSVDSDVICGSISKTQNTESLSEIDGPAAIIYTDTNKEGVLKIFRNNERPLFRGHCEEGMYISSIKESLIFIGCKNIKEFVSDYVYTIFNGLILVKPKLIKNKAYYHNFHNVNSSVNTNSQANSFYSYKECLDFKNCRVRLDTNSTISINEFVLVPNEYYLIKDVNADRTLVVYDDISGTERNIFYNLFNKQDIIRTGCLVKSLYKIYSHDDNKNILIKYGQVVRATNVDADTDEINLVDAIDGSKICTANKNYFVKLSKEEIREHINDKVINVTQNNKIINLTGPVNESNNNTNSEEIEEDHEFNELSDYFAKMNDKLENLNEVVHKTIVGASDIKFLIVDLIDENFKASNVFLEDFEEEVIDNA